MTLSLPPFVGEGPFAPNRRRNVRSALLAYETQRHRSIRVVQLAMRQAPHDSQEWRAWFQLLHNLRTADPWRT